jgi:bifunctional DNA-binding transcriptional regulator/antitoxin component of YhaV-PrlF toxin-antitoxin module
MIEATLRKVGDEYQVTIPHDEVERLGLAEGQKVAVNLSSPGEAPDVSARREVKDAFDASWERNERGYRYLAGR